MDNTQIAMALIMGVSLSAACGFRIFVPLLVVGLAVKFWGLHATPALSWTATDLGLIVLGVATLVEIAAYYIPVVDNFLDTIHGPLAVIAGTILVGGLLVDMPPALQWGLGIVAGGGAAAAVKAGAATLRAASTTATAGFGNCIVATAENGCAAVGSVLAVVAPIVAAIGLVVLVALVCSSIYKRSKGTEET